MDPSRFSWSDLCCTLNELCEHLSIDDPAFERARQCRFPQAENHPSEDFLLHGELWAELYLPKGFAPARANRIDKTSYEEARRERVLFLAVSVAFRTEYMQFDVQRKRFFALNPNARTVHGDSLVSSRRRPCHRRSEGSNVWMGAVHHAPRLPSWSVSCTKKQDMRLTVIQLDGYVDIALTPAEGRDVDARKEISVEDATTEESMEESWDVVSAMEEWE